MEARISGRFMVDLLGRKACILPVTGKRGLSLSRCQRVLAASAHGHAPSLSTLQRHAADGDLIHCEVPGSGKRARYDPEKVRDRYRDWAGASPTGRPAAVAMAGVGQSRLRPEDVEQIAGAVGALVLHEIALLARTVAGLNGVRASLMQKYDASSAAALARAESLAAQLVDAKRLIDLDMRVARLSAEVSRLSELLAKGARAPS